MKRNLSITCGSLYGPEDRRFLTGAVRAHLRDWLGYDYEDRSAAPCAPAHAAR